MSTVPIPGGFLFSAAEAAIKKPGRPDMGLIVSEGEAAAAGTFTKNRVKAAPVLLDRERVRTGRGQAIIVNSGNANACTGRRGMQDARTMAEHASRVRGLNPSLVFVCSTGVIGLPLPMDRVTAGVSRLLAGLGHHTFSDVARAIMTTDTFPKMSGRVVTLSGKKVSIAACAKGAGMIAPDMATMLCFIITDAAVEKQALKAALRESVDSSFNRITIDGDMSTNDTALILANGFARNREIRMGTKNYRIFRDAMFDITWELAQMIVRDGEGAKKLIEINISGARSAREADRAAKSVANSLLVKTALYGSDANWGRIMAALGYSGAAFREERVEILFDDLPVVKHGLATGQDAEANALLRKDHIRLSIRLHAGSASAKVLTCDLSEEYVRINAEYRT